MCYTFSHNHFHLGQFSIANQPTCMFFDSGMKLEHLEETDVMVKMYKNLYKIYIWFKNFMGGKTAKIEDV